MLIRLRKCRFRAKLLQKWDWENSLLRAKLLQIKLRYVFVSKSVNLNPFGLEPHLYGQATWNEWYKCSPPKTATAETISTIKWHVKTNVDAEVNLGVQHTEQPAVTRGVSNYWNTIVDVRKPSVRTPQSAWRQASENLLRSGHKSRKADHPAIQAWQSAFHQILRVLLACAPRLTHSHGHLARCSHPGDIPEWES